MLTATCHCGALTVGIPEAPTEITSCNCSLCRRFGLLWAYYAYGEVEVPSQEALTDDYIQGDRTLRTVRCKVCGCITHWELLGHIDAASRVGINIRNFAPEVFSRARTRLVDGADTWTSSFIEPPPTA